jgi:hypothetical protein
MAKHARIENGKVAEVGDFDTIEGRFHPSLIWKPCPLEVTVGWANVGDTFTAPSPEPIGDVKALAKSRIDIKAEQVRAKYLTAAPLQSATYVEKAREAREFKTAGYPSAPFAPATWPYVDAEMRAAGDATPQAACDRILAEAAQYAQVKGAAIEYERRHGKITVDAGGTIAVVNAAEAAALAALDVL